MDRLKSSEPSMSKPSRRDKILETLLSTVKFIAMVSTTLADSLEVSLKRRRRQGADDDVGNHQFGSLPLSLMGRRRSINASVEIEVQEESNSPRELELNLPSLQSPTNTSNSSSESTLDAAQALLASAQIKKFTYRELSEATNDFSQVNFLGEGGFGSVYKGVLAAGDVVAVKKLKDGSFQGDREFLNEIEVISRVHHHNLVSLVGYCISESKRLLVYEYLENNNLATHLLGEKSAVLDWSTRMSIAMGAATGIAYLHEQCCPRIIHRDIKSTNILLDSNYKSKVADFGLAKLLRHDETRVVTRVIGTCGYLDPEYATTWILTEKSDVFSFGVILLELIIGQHPGNLRDWETLLDQALESGEFSSGLVDPKLGRNYDNEEMNRMVACATVSVRPSRDRRPRMSQVLQVLQGNISVEVLKALTSSLDCDPVPSSPHVQQ